MAVSDQQEAEQPKTHQTNPEPQAKFDIIRARVGLGLGPLAFLAMLVLPTGLDGPQRSLAAVFLLVIVWWITEAVPLAVTALLGIVLCVLLGVGDEDTVFGAFGSDTIFVLLGGFVIARAMSVHGLDRRLAFRILSIRGVAQSPVRMVVAFGAMTALVSAFISNTATATMVFPIGLGIIGAVSAISTTTTGRDLRRSRISTALMLMIAYGASIGGLFTPIGAPHQLIGRDLVEKQSGRTIGFLEWVALFAPLVIVMFVVLSVVLLWMNRPEVKRLDGAEDYIAGERAKLGGLSRGERNTLVAFVLAVVLWTGPGFLQLFLGEDNAFVEWVLEHVTEGVAAILAASVLFLLPLGKPAEAGERRRPTLGWSDAARIDWGTILLFGAGIVLGKLSSETGLAKLIGNGLADLLGVSGLVGVTILAAVTALLVSETTSNTASAGIVVPIVVPIAQAIGVDPLIPGLVATAAAGYGFMLPVSTPPNAIVYGSGLVPITRMVRSGIVFDILGVAVLVAGVLLLAPILGL